MGLFDFFRKIPKIKIEESKILREKIAFSEIENWIEKKKNDVELNEKSIFSLIQKKMDVFIKELEEKISILKSVDVEGKKAEEVIKSVVNEGKGKYIGFLENFMERLKGLRKERLDKFVKDINKIFFDFNKSSNNSYERTTILIGKEMANIKDSLKVFSRDLIKVFDENKNLGDFFDKISVIKSNLSKVEEIEKDFKKIDEKIVFLDKEILEREKEEKEILEEIEKVKKSEAYLKNLEIEERVRLLKTELEKDILSLKQFIDFKALANFFHIFEEQMDIVKSHRDDFQTSFKKDDGRDIIGLLNESKLNNEKISEKIRHINNKKEEMAKIRQDIRKDGIKELYFERIKKIHKIDDLKGEKSTEEKRHSKIKANKKELIDMIREDLEKMDVDVEV